MRNRGLGMAAAVCDLWACEVAAVMSDKLMGGYGLGVRAWLLAMSRCLKAERAASAL